MRIVIKLIAVLAGTPIDTAMGVRFVEGYGFEVKGYHVSLSPEEQSLLQVVHPEKLYEIVSGLLGDMKSIGIETVFVYCNSISAAVDMDKLSIAHHLRIITPLHIYVEMGLEYGCLGVLAANNQSTHGIERAIQEKSPLTQVIGTGMLKLVNAVESGMSPEKIIGTYELPSLLNFYLSAGCEAVILGCTHFSYFYEELKRTSPLPLIDPTVRMIEKIREDTCLEA